MRIKNNKNIKQERICFLIYQFFVFQIISTEYVKGKDWSETKRTILGVDHFTTISGHSLANYINSFHKTVTVTMKCPNHNWIKSYGIKHIFFASSFLQFCKKKERKFMTHKWPLNDHFWPIFRQLRQIFHKTEIQTVILRRLVCLNPAWIKSNNIISVKIFFSCL